MHQLVKILLIKSCTWRYMCLNMISVLESYLKINQFIRSQYLRPSISWPSISLNGIRCFSYYHAQFAFTVRAENGVGHDCYLDLDVVTLNANLMRCDTRIPFVPDADALEYIGWHCNGSYCQIWPWVFTQPFADQCLVLYLIQIPKIHMRILKVRETVAQHGWICL